MAEDFTGKVFGRLRVLCLSSKTLGGKKHWKCACVCGNNVDVSTHNLKSGHTKSCGCLSKEIMSRNMSTHGMSRSREYTIWSNMKQRCLDKNHTNYAYYGGRGICVSSEWLDFEVFFGDMGSVPEGMELDRRDVNGNYCKENCSWVSKSQQAYNRRKSAANTSGRTGVSYVKGSGKWVAYISYERSRTMLGYFDSFAEAVEARESAEIMYYGKIKEITT